MGAPSARSSTATPRSAAIAAASIVAKVTRDRYMHRADERASGLGLRRARRLLDARAPRGDPAPGRLAAAPDVLPVARLPAAARSSARLSSHHAPSRCSSASSRPARRAPRRSRRSASPRPAGACAAVGQPGERQPPQPQALARTRASPAGPPPGGAARRAPPAAVLTSTKTSVRRRRRSGRSRPRGCGRCARATRSRGAAGGRRRAPRRAPEPSAGVHPLEATRGLGCRPSGRGGPIVPVAPRGGRFS